ncbi:MAG: hypothetical protein M3300_06770 [Actinomycetota bacterium]|nr:hypothetical protein [Actinomycetota bacterium]
MPSPADAASNMPVHLLSRSRINIVNSSSAVAEAQQARNLPMTPVRAAELGPVIRDRVGWAMVVLS